VAEQNSDREDREDREKPEPGSGPEEKGVPFDEEAAWAAIVEGYGQEPPDPPGARPYASVEDLAALETGKAGEEEAKPAPASSGLGGSVAFAPGVGPRDHSPAEPDEDDPHDGDGHFVPPEPPPLPAADTTAKFAWLAVVGGPVVLLLAVLLGWDMTWWLATVGVGGFLGGFTTLVTRMRTDDEEGDDPGRGAVV
jgi:hypothetical protein